MEDWTNPAGWEFAIVARDPLSRHGLASLLEDASSRFFAGVELSPEKLDAEDLGDAQGVLWEYEAKDAVRVAGLAASIPVVVFVEDAESGRDAWARGARAVLPRGVAPERLAAAIPAALEGLRILDPSFELGPASHEPPPNVPELSTRESEVLMALADGASNKEIAETLGVSVNTAKFHVRSILDKLGAESRTEAVVLAARWGLIVL